MILGIAAMFPSYADPTRLKLVWAVESGWLRRLHQFRILGHR